MTKPPLQAFSLVEVVLAIGLVTFCLVALVALFNVGLTTSRQAATDTVVAGLISQITSEMQALPGSVTNNTPRLYDIRGQLADTTASAFYACSITTATVSTNEFPGISTNLVRLTIQLTAPATVPAANRKWTNTFHGVIPAS